jgi:hypothetical protein
VKQGSALQVGKIREEMKGDGVLASYPYYVSTYFNEWYSHLYGYVATRQYFETGAGNTGPWHGRPYGLRGRP